MAALFDLWRRRRSGFAGRILRTIAALGGEAHTIAILDELGRGAGPTPGIVRLHFALEDLLSTGMVSARMGEATAERGWRRRRYYALTDKGRASV